jgi:hypothetical protein
MELVAVITPVNEYPEVNWGNPMGKEIWQLIRFLIEATLFG